MDNYVEHMVKRKDPGYFLLLKLACVILDIFALIIALSNAYGLILLILAGILSYIVWLFSSVEYDYLYMSGSFTVEQILNRSRRKKLLDTNASELLLVAPKGSASAKDMLGQGLKTMDLSGTGDESRKYAYIMTRNGEKHCYYIDMPEKLLKEMRYHTPSKVKLQ